YEDSASVSQLHATGPRRGSVAISDSSSELAWQTTRKGPGQSRVFSGSYRMMSLPQAISSSCTVTVAETAAAWGANRCGEGISRTVISGRAAGGWRRASTARRNVSGAVSALPTSGIVETSAFVVWCSRIDGCGAGVPCPAAVGTMVGTAQTVARVTDRLSEFARRVGVL